VDAGVPRGSRIVAFDSSNPESEVVNLAPDFAAAGRPDLSFDAQQILFVGKRSPADPLSVWEMSAEGTAHRQVVSLAAGCDDAIYLSTIYTLDAERPVHQIAFRGCGTGFQPVKNRFHSALYTSRLDGSRVRQITFSPNGVFDPYLLSDGRLLVSIETGPGEANAGDIRTGGTALYALHVDGTELFPFAGVHEVPAVRGMPCETPDGWIVYVESTAASSDRGGSLVAVARTRSLRTRRLVADDMEGLYHSPSPMVGGNLLVSYRAKSGGSYGLFVFDPHRGKRTAQVFDSPRWHEVDAVAVAPRPEPAGRSSVVDDGVNSAQLYCLNAYLSDTAVGKRIKPGGIKHLRVIQALTDTGSASDDGAQLRLDRKSLLKKGTGTSPEAPSGGVIGHELGASPLFHSGESGRVKETVLGEIPVEKDGSFFLELPARMPLRLETLGDGGDVLQAMRTWMWLMPSERRGCIGCHEDRELTPPNRHVLALRKRPIAVGVPKRKAVKQDTAAYPKGGYGR
jgi:hypothetical protein